MYGHFWIQFWQTKIRSVYCSFGLIACLDWTCSNAALPLQVMLHVGWEVAGGMWASII